jgi:hypothetical protein
VPITDGWGKTGVPTGTIGQLFGAGKIGDPFLI